MRLEEQALEQAINDVAEHRPDSSRRPVRSYIRQIDPTGGGEASNDEGIFLSHHGKDFRTVALEVLEKFPEETFCFLNAGKLRETAGILRDYFLPGNQARAIAYAIKANPKKRILEILSEEGIRHFDCASSGEIDAVKEINPKAEIFFNHPIKTSADIFHAAGSGVHHFTVQAHQEIVKIMNNAFPNMSPDPVEIAVRLRTPNEKAKIDLSTKYGVSHGAASSMIYAIRKMIGAVPGISIHTGSQNEDPRIFVEAIRYMADVARESGGVKTMNVGGGIPVNYAENDNFQLKQYVEMISAALESNSPGALLEDPKLIIELGRAVVGECIDLVIPVLAAEEREKKTIYINDGVFTSFSDYAIHGWQYNFKTIGEKGRTLSANKIPYVVFGRTCDSGDTLGEVLLPEDLTDRDFLWLQNAGAYMDSQSTRFNGFDPPKYVSYNP